MQNEINISFSLLDQDIAPQYAGFIHGMYALESNPQMMPILGHVFTFSRNLHIPMPQIYLYVVPPSCPCCLCCVFVLRIIISARFFTGISNSAGTIAAIMSTIGTGVFVQWLGSFQAFLTLTAFLYFATAIFWNLYATGERVFYQTPTCTNFMKMEYIYIII